MGYYWICFSVNKDTDYFLKTRLARLFLRGMARRASFLAGRCVAWPQIYIGRGSIYTGRGWIYTGRGLDLYRMRAGMRPVRALREGIRKKDCALCGGTACGCRVLFPVADQKFTVPRLRSTNMPSMALRLNLPARFALNLMTNSSWSPSSSRKSLPLFTNVG